MGIEKTIAASVGGGMVEKTFIDKLLAREDSKRLQELIKKPTLTREELLEILYLITGTESKLLNYDEYDRYIILKFFVWIREFVKIAELIFDYQENMTKLAAKNKIQLSDRAKRMFDNCMLIVQHDAKFLIDLYLNIARTTLSVGGVGLSKFVDSKYEFEYSGNTGANMAIPQKPNFAGVR